MAVPGHQTLMRPLLEILQDGQEHLTRDTYALLADHFGLTPEDRNEMIPSGSQRLLDNRVGWAKTYLLKASKLSPGNPDVMKNMAKSYEMTKDYDKAIATYQEMATHEGPNAYEAYTHLGNIYWLKGDTAKARANVLRALALNPDYDPAKKLLSKLPK